MNFILGSIFSFTILIAGIIALIRFRQIHKTYYLFLYFVWLACLNELLSYFLATTKHSTFLNNNIYVLFESLLIILFLKKRLSAMKYNIIFHILIVSIIGAWGYENLILGKIFTVSSYFRVYYSFVLVLLSITTINKLLSTVRTNIFANSVFLICIGFILYFTIKILVEIFWLYGIYNQNFQSLVYNIIIYINLFTNLIYALAILWMPKKQIFTMPS